MRVPATIDQALEGLRKLFDADAAAGAQVVYQFELAGASGGVFHLAIDHGTLAARAEPAERPDVIFRCAAADGYGILGGRENADLLYMEGRLEIQGNPTLAGKIRTYFRAG